MRPLAAASLLVLALTACGGPSEEDVLTEEKIRASQSAPQLPDIQLSENPEPPPAPPQPPVQQPTLNELDNAVEENVLEPGVPGTIPPAFQGLWGQVQSDCRAGDVVGTGMMVTPDWIGFADSIGQLAGVLADSPRRFAGRFEYEDGGARREDLTLSGSNVLVRTAAGQSFTYRRCGAGRTTG